MQKVKSNALWRGLSDQQQETLDHWLFKEGLSYVAILPRARAELGFKGGMSSLKRYFARRDKERTLTRFESLRYEVLKVQGAPVNEKELRIASMRLLCEFLFKQARLHPENVKEWGMIASLIVDNDRNELLRELKGEELKMRQQAMDFAREKFQFDMVKRALKALPELLELTEAKRDPATKEYEESIRLNRAMCAMFGARRVRPESDQEAREMLNAKREREARQRAEQEAAAERRRVRDELGGAQPPLPSSRYYAEYMAEQAEGNPVDLEPAIPESEPQASAATQAERVEREKLREQQEAERAVRKEQREQREREAQARIEEMREVCGWQEVQRPPGTEEG